MNKEKEIETVTLVVRRYCRGVHGTRSGALCPACAALLEYARQRRDRCKPWEYAYDPANDTYTCPRGGVLRHTTTDRDGKRTYRSTPEQCRNCPCKAKCGANEKGQKTHTTHI